jgi:hypothetical protein
MSVHRHVRIMLLSILCCTGLETNYEKITNKQKWWASSLRLSANNWTVLLGCSAITCVEMLVLSERPHLGSLDPLGHDFCSYCMTDCGCLNQHSHFHWSQSPYLAIFTFPATHCIWKTTKGWILTSPTTTQNYCFELCLTLSLVGSLWVIGDI